MTSALFIVVMALLVASIIHAPKLNRWFSERRWRADLARDPDFHAEFRTVRIPAKSKHSGMDSTAVTLKWRCPVCAGPRGEPKEVISQDGSRRLYCHIWTNPCGHIDLYQEVLKEARAA